MAFLVEDYGRIDYREFSRRQEAYERYLLSIEASLPPSAFAFATASWHYVFIDHRCLHDAWVESLELAEVPPEGRTTPRRMSVNVRLLGAYHDGYAHLEYLDVTGYDLRLPYGSQASPRPAGGHGDWLIDEVRLSDTGRVLHDVAFADGARWLIECADVRYRWMDSDIRQQALREAVEREPSSAKAHYDLSVALAEAERWAEALEEAGEAVRLDTSRLEYRQLLRQIESHIRSWHEDGPIPLL